MSCPHSEDMEPEWCGLCKGKPSIEAPEKVAEHESECPICQHTILIGQIIICRNLRWMHRGCR